MRRIKNIMLIALAFLAMACNKEAKNAVTLSGKIENPTGTELGLYNGEGKLMKGFTLSKDGAFEDTVQNVEGYFMLSYGNEAVSIYLEKESDLKITASSANFEKSLNFTGGNLKEANLLINNISKNYAQKLETIGIQNLFSKSEAEFLAFIEEFDNNNLKMIDNADVSSELAEWERKKVHYNKYYLMYVYPLNYRILKDSIDYTPSQKYLDVQGTIDYTNSKDYEQLSSYRNLVMEHFSSRFDNSENEEVAKEVLREIKELPIKKFVKRFAYRLMPTVTDSKSDIEKKEAYIRYITDDKKILTKLDELLADINSLKPGVASPLFTYESIDGKKVALADLKGKLVYIDVWATWCGPCKAEIPYLQKLEREYHKKNIHFVSISVDQDKKAWENMVKKDKLGGLQLWANSSRKSDFIDSYKIKGIPRFILLDKEGKIINANAPRPSSKEIKLLFNECLEK